VTDYTPVYGQPLVAPFTAGAAITGGQVLAFTAADTVSPASGPTAAFAGVAAHDAAPGAPVSVLMGAGVVHETTTGAQLPAPAAPVPTTSPAGGTVADGVYKVTVTYVNASGETVASAQGTVTAAGGGTSTITVPSPGAQAGATGWFAYVSQPGGNTLTRQQGAGAPTAIGTPLTLTAPPTSGGAQSPAGNTTGVSAGELVSAAAAGQVAGTSAAGLDIGVAVRASPSAGGLVRWKTTRG
jgi:hypothetical protein